MNTSLQISRAELLLLLGTLNLPMPLALGEYPADQDIAALGVALAAATASLAARDLLTLPEDPTSPPIAQPAVAALLSDVALAEACLIHTCKRGGNSSVVHLTRRGMAYVAHSCPQPGVHRFVRLADQAALVDQLVMALAIAPDAPDDAVEGFTLQAEPLAGALDALCAGDAANARARLLAAGAPLSAVNALCKTVPPGLTRHALVALRGLDTAAPQADCTLVLSGRSPAWLGAADPGEPTLITLRPATAAAVHARVGVLVAWMG